MLPQFDASGNLPVGIYQCSWNEFVVRFGYNYKRKMLLNGLHNLVALVSSLGEPIIYVGGSFVTDKLLPGDFDACWDYVNRTDPILQSLADTYPIFLDMDYPRINQKNAFGGEFFPAFGIEQESGKTFLEFFQRTKDTNQPKGIVQLILNDFV